MLRALPSVLALLACLVATGGLRAEEADSGVPTMPFAVQDTNAARFAVKEVRRLLDTGRGADGLRLAQEVLDGMPEDYYRLPSSEASVRWRLAADLVRDTLAALSAEQRADYDRLSHAAAHPLLERAFESRGHAELADVVARFGASKTGIDAARLLADLTLEQGHGREAAHWARRALRFAPRDAGLWVRRIDGLGSVGDGAALASLTLPDDVQALPDGQGRTVAERLAAWRTRVPTQGALDGWPMWGGVPARSATPSAAGPRPDTLRWQSRVTVQKGILDEDEYRGGYRDRVAEFDARWDHFRPFHPAVEGRVVYVADGRSVRALDLYSGVPLWTFDADHQRDLRLVRPDERPLGRTSLERAFAPVVWKDLVLATVEVRRPYRPEMLQVVEISTYLPHRVLVALDRRDGSLRWVSGSLVEDLTALGEITMVSPCVVAEDLAVVVASRNQGGFHDVFFLAFEAATGRLAWKRHVGLGNQELNLFGSPVKELAASAPAVAEGTVFASTGLGFTAALDLRTGAPKWLASYEIQKIESVQVWFEAPVRFPRVAPSPPIVTGDLLLVAPTDGRHLHAYDRHDGRLRWRVPYPPPPLVGATAHFLGVANDGRRDVALVTGTDLLAYDLSDGEHVWTGRLQDEYDTRNVPVGCGAIAEGHVLVPTRTGLVRFSLTREGSFEGRDPWPRHVLSGNLLPLARLLLVTARDRLQAFYSWEEIERDVARRRGARPNDPGVLLEAGEIYRMGGAHERARAAFQEALGLARREGRTKAERAAEQGLYRAWLDEAERQTSSRPAEALSALENAIEWSRTPSEQVRARLRLDALLKGSPQERAANLEAIAAVAAGLRAEFPGSDEPVPARAMALIKLAQVRVQQGKPVDAIDALQELIREEGDSEILGRQARDLAREHIDEIQRVWGSAPYRAYEEEAEQLLARARDDPQTDLLDRILRDFPNATVVPTALLGLGERLLANGRADDASRTLRRLVAEHAHHPSAPKAAAVLSRAYDVMGLDGGQRFALLWLSGRHPEASFELQGSTFTGASFAAAEMHPPRVELPPDSTGLRLPLREELFQPVAEGSWGREVELASETDGPAPVALLSDGRSLVVFDLVGARVAFRLDAGSCYRALHADGVLVLALSRELRGVTADTGQTLWELELNGSVMDLEGAGGLAFALVHDPSGRGESRHLLAVDTSRGRILWRLPLGRRSRFQEVQTHGSNLLLRGTRYEASRALPEMLVVDGLSGRLRHVVMLPPEGRTDKPPIVVGDLVVVAAGDRKGTRHLSAHRIETGELAWTLPLPGMGRVCALAQLDGRIVVLQSDGSLGTYDAADGKPSNLTRIFVGERGQRRADACPHHGTEAIVLADRLVLMPRAQKPPPIVGAWSRETGKLLWLTRFDEEHNPSRSALLATDDYVLTLTPSTPRGGPAQVHLRILDLRDGTVRQEIEPMGLTAEYALLSMATGWNAVVVFGRAGAMVYAGAPDPGAKDR